MKFGALLRELTFRTLIDRFEQLFDGLDGKSNGASTPQLGLFDSAHVEAPSAEGKAEAPPCAIAATPEAVKELADRAMACQEIVVDVRLEGGRHPSRSAITAMCIGCSPTDVTYIPLGHTDGLGADSDQMLEILRPLLESETPTKVVHNAKPAIEARRAAGIELRGLTFDTMIAAFLLESGQRSADLGSLAFSQLNLQLPTPSSLLGTGQVRAEVSRGPYRRSCVFLL